MEVRLEGLTTSLTLEQEALCTYVVVPRVDLTSILANFVHRALMELDSARGTRQEQAAIIMSLEHSARILEQEKLESIETYALDTLRRHIIDLAIY